jgi:hypothetical protein
MKKKDDKLVARFWAWKNKKTGKVYWDSRAYSKREAETYCLEAERAVELELREI